MQLARNIFAEEISREKTLTRKLKEARVAVEIERNFPKDTILQLYLNQIDLGAGAHGVEAAAQIYFGKSARQLNVAERSEEHTSELQSQSNLVCRLLLEKKKKSKDSNNKPNIR